LGFGFLLLFFPSMSFPHSHLQAYGCHLVHAPRFRPEHMWWCGDSPETENEAANHRQNRNNATTTTTSQKPDRGGGGGVSHETDSECDGAESGVASHGQAYALADERSRDERALLLRMESDVDQVRCR
jgi:hypothetical protein